MAISRARNIFNAFICLALPVWIFRLYSITPLLAAPATHDTDTQYESQEQQRIEFAMHPLLELNALLFVWMDVVLWILGVVFQNHWLIDPYWTIIPLYVAMYLFKVSPYYAITVLTPSQLMQKSISDPSFRVIIASALLCLWSIRLTHSYFRRENYRFGEREDWRFTQMQQQLSPVIGKCGWILASFAIVYLSQHVLLFGIMAPFYPIYFSTNPLNILDIIATVGAISGMLIAYFADTTLRRFMVENENRLRNGLPKQLILETGMWKYSRHPNYFGETMFWCSIGLFCLSSTYQLQPNSMLLQFPVEFHSSAKWYYPYCMIGCVLNTLCLLIVSGMVEKRMESDTTRLEAFKQYQQRVSLIIPWFRSSSSTHPKHD